MTNKTQGRPGSKFSGLLAAVKDRNEDAAPEAILSANESTKVGSELVNEETVVAKRGRPPGKRSSADFVQVTAYVGKQTHRQVKIALLSEEENREFSELVEDLLTEWLGRRH